MTIDADICYRAVRARDARFDGRFFTAVSSTGIYCRPVCPAPAPARRHVSFYSSAAAAEAAGYRPCRRCRPETSPGTPAWAGTSSTVTRALRLIGAGALDGDGDVDTLSARLGVTARHLRRLFDEHLGASPVAVAQARRVHFAKHLLDNTAMPITQIALSSGFASIRRFNDTFRRTFDRSPRETRERAGRSARDVDGGLELRLSFREPYDFDAMLAFFGPRAIPGVESVTGETYRRAVSIGGTHGIIDVTRAPKQRHLLLRIPSALSPHALDTAERIRRQFDLTADSRAVEEQLAADPILKDAVAGLPGARVPGSWDPFETVVRAILGQQVTVKAATTLVGRIAAAYGTRIADGETCSTIFPAPSRLRRARIERLGVTGTRARAIRAIASLCDTGALQLDGATDLDELTSALCDIPGVGPWTAHYIAMRACSEPDAFPSGDLILRRAVERIDPDVDTEKKLIARAEAWRPWRAYATLFLWRWFSTLETKTTKD